LAACEDCARERSAFQHLAALAATESARIGTPITSWEQLAPALKQNGLIEVARVGRGRTLWLQAAAAAFLLVGGVVAGRISASVGAAKQAPVSVAAAPAEAPVTFASLDEARAAQAAAQSAFQFASSF